jgi:hypothetical protein
MQPSASAAVTATIVLLNTSFSYQVQLGNAWQLPIVARHADTFRVLDDGALQSF